MFRKLMQIAVLPALVGIFACSDDKTSGVSVEDNAIANGDSSSFDETISSSSLVIIGPDAQSSSSVAVAICKQDLWDGTTGVPKVNTGNENTGYWYTWDDGSSSKIIFPVETGNEYSGNKFEPVVESCEGFCGTIEFGTISEPEAGFGFSVAEEGETVDISSWDGLCLTYSSDVAFTMFLVSGLGNKLDMDSYPSVSMPSLHADYNYVTTNFLDPETPVTRCAKWRDFAVYKNYEVERLGDEDAKKAKAIGFKFRGTSGTKAKFNIRSIGTFDERLPHVYDDDPDKFYNGVRITDADSATCVWKGVLYEQYQTEDAAGTWFTYGDEIGSKIVYPIDLGYYSWQSVWGFDPLLDYCGGFCATMGFDRYEDGDMFLGVGLVFAGREIEENCGDEECFDRLKTADIEDWGGVCITYYSEKDAYLKLGIDVSYYEDMASNDFPIVQIPKSTTMAERCYKWSDFDNMSSEKLKKVSTIAFEVRSEVNHEQTNFNVAAIGKYSAQGACSLKASTEPYILPESSASIVPVESSSSMSERVSSSSWQFKDECGFQEIDNLWFGPDGYPQVETFFSDESETSGYWYVIEDESEAEISRIIWPVPIGNEYASDAKDPVVDYCAGICAKAVFKRESYAGVGFDIRGTQPDGQISIWDATEWGGMCVTYASESDIDIVMYSNSTYAFSDLSKFPKATLPKSIGVVTKCVDWSAFKYSDGVQGNPKVVGSIYFVINSDDAMKYKFNIIGLGKYQELSEAKSACIDKDNFVAVAD